MADAAGATGRTASEAPAARPRGTWLVTPLFTSTPLALDTLTVDRTAVAVNLKPYFLNSVALCKC